MAKTITDLTDEEFEELSAILKAERERKQAAQICDQWCDVIIKVLLPRYRDYCQGDYSWSVFFNFWDSLDKDLLPSGVDDALLSKIHAAFVNGIETLYSPFFIRHSFMSKNNG